MRATPRPLFTQRWVNGAKDAPESGMAGLVSIYDDKNSQSLYDPVTDTWNDVRELVYTGKARVQPLRSDSTREVPGNDTTVQNVLFSLPITETLGLDFRPGLIGVVDFAPLNPVLTAYQYVLNGVVDSTNPLERTLMFTVNQETEVA